jgi:cytochrome c peroxidase
MRLALWFLAACAPEGAAPTDTDPPADSDGPADTDVAPDLRALLALPDHLELPRIPDYNPITAASISLGRHLFYDRRLSGNQTQSCADCHHQDKAFADGARTSTGSTGEVLARNSPGLANVAWLGNLTWAHDGFIDLESQLEVPLINDRPVELGLNDGNFPEVMARLEADPVYVDLLAAAWPDSESGFTLPKLTFALASFCRSLVSGDSPYDRFYAGDRDALSESARRGMTLFNGERFECFHCHGGVNATSSYRDANTEQGSAVTAFFNTGLYNVDGEGSYPAHDQGLYDLTLNPRHRGAFRPPSLRNVALTAPYLHDGSVATLRDVLATYMAGGRNVTEGPFAGDGRVSPLKSGLVRGFTATEAEIDDVIAFLDSMTDPAFLTNPAYADPWAAAP